jgi:cobalt/nickel transport system permease protein
VRLKDLYRTDIYDERRGPSFSPLILFVVTLSYIVTVVSFGRYETFRLFPLASYPIFIGSFTRVSFRDLFRKMVPVLPFIIFIGILNPFFDTARTEYLGIVISKGWISFFSLILKFMLIVPASLIMVAATGFDGLCRTAASVGLPDVLVTQLFLLHRYIRLLVEETHNIVRARVFRGGKITVANAGNVCGPLLLRCISRSERIHSALECRGFDGQLYHSSALSKRVPAGELIFALCWIVFFTVVRMLDISRIIGDMIVGCVI